MSTPAQPEASSEACKQYGKVGWNELMTPDPAAAVAFYSTLFGWTTEKFPMPHTDYTIFKCGGEMFGGVLATPEPGRGARIDHDARHFHEPCLNAAQGPGAGALVVQIRQKHRIRFVEGPDSGPPQGADMAVAAKASAEIAGDRADIGSLAAACLEDRLIGLGAEEIERVDRHRTRS